MSPPSSLYQLSDQWMKGYKQVYSVNLVISGENLFRATRFSQRWWFCLVVGAQWPLAVNLLVVYPIEPTWAVMQPRALMWFVSFGLANSLMLLAALTAWTFVAERMYLVDAVLKRSPTRASVTYWLANSMAHRRQSILPIIGATLGPAFLSAIQNQLNAIIKIAPTSFLIVAWTGFIGGNVLYWLWVAAGVAKQIQRCPQLSLRWHDPANTPGLRLLGEGYFLSALFLLAGVITISVLGFWLPRVVEIPALLWLLYSFFALSVLTSLRIMAIPFYWIWRIVTHAKARTLNYIANQLELPELYLSTKLPTSTGQLISVYQAVSVSQNLPFSTVVVIQYGAALAGSVVAFVAGQFAGAGTG